jgi:hypothetical protein
MKPASSMSDNIAWFESRAEALKAQYGDRWLVVVDCEVRASYSDFGNAAEWAEKRALERLERGEVLIRHTVQTKHTIPAIIVSGDAAKDARIAELEQLLREAADLYGKPAIHSVTARKNMRLKIVAALDVPAPNNSIRGEVDG